MIKKIVNRKVILEIAFLNKSGFVILSLKKFNEQRQVKLEEGRYVKIFLPLKN